MATLLDSDYRALVIGSSGAIGRAFVEALHQDPRCMFVEALSRSESVGFDLLNPASLAAQAAVSAKHGPYRLIVDATGVLTIDGIGPEKSLTAIQPDIFAKAFANIHPCLVRCGRQSIYRR